MNTLTSSTVENIHIFEDEGGRSSIAQIEVNDKVLVNGQQQTVLNLNASADMSVFEPGMTVYEVGNGGDADGTIESINGFDCLKLFGIEDNWDVGSYVAIVGSESSPGRFTDRDFTTTAVMLDNGNPASTKSIRGWVEGSLTEKIETDEITAVDTSTSPVYSARMTGTPDVGYPFTNIFDGNRSTWCNGNNTDLTFSPSPAIPFKKIEIYYPSADSTTHSVDVNGTPATISYVGNSWVELKGIAHGDLTSLVMKGNQGGYCGGIRIDGLELIDNKTTPALTFASGQDLAKLQPGNTIYQEDATLQPALFFNTGFINNRWDNPIPVPSLDPSLVIENVPVGDYFPFPGGAQYSMWYCWSDVPGGTFVIKFKSTTDSRGLRLWFSDDGVTWNRQGDRPFYEMDSSGNGSDL